MRKTCSYIPVAIVLSVVLFGACSTKKNTAMSRFWQSFTTRYNVYYNGMTNYNEQIKTLENDYEDDYSQPLFIHPAEAYTFPKSPQPKGSFDRTIEKMQKAIALHSIKKKPQKKAGKGNDEKYKAYMKRDEYNPFIHNAWYMLAKSEYMKGDFLASSATFHYISRHFTWMPDLVLEAKIWEALSYCALGWTTEADNVLAHVHIDQIEKKSVRALANLAFADYYIKSEKSAEAIPYLAEAVKGAHGAQKVRLNFLLGQLYERTGQNDLAYLAFKKAGSSSGSTYRTKFNARIKQSAVYQGANIKPEVRALKNMTHYDRNKDYLDQVYYAIGNLYLQTGDTVNAVDNYRKAAEKSTRNGIDKAISQLTLGGIYFNQHKYDLAQPCYAEAIPLLADTYPHYKELKKRSDVLDELAVYAQNVTLQDSLLRLSQMPIEEQKKVVKKIIDDLKKKEKEEAENAQREAYLADQAAKGNTNGTQNKANAPASYNINTDQSWYFYNTVTKNSGKTAFQQQWGNRKLEDNWRRRNKNTFSFADDDSADDTAAADSTAAPGDTTMTKEQKEALKRSEDPHYEEYYLKQIPSTPEMVQTANDIIQEGLYNMALILKDKLEDYSAAEEEFNELLRRYPDNIYRLDIYYNMYLIAMRGDRLSDAESWRQLILTNFADSKYGQAMEDPAYLDNLKQMGAVQEQLYTDAYNNYLNNNNEAVHAAYAEMMRKYPLSELMPKFMFIDALSYVTQKNYDKFKEVLKEMLERYPETDITPTATSIVKQLKAGRQLNGGGSNVRGMQWNTFALSNDSTGNLADKAEAQFKDNKDGAQVFVLVYNTDSVSANQLLFEVARHNFRSFTVRDYDIEQMTFGAMGLLIVKGFANYNELISYRTVFEGEKNFTYTGQEVHQVLISEENFKLLLNEGRSFEEYFRYLDAQNEKDQAAKIPDSATDDASTDVPATPMLNTDVKKSDSKTEPQPETPQPEKKEEAKKQEPKIVPENPDLVIDDGVHSITAKPQSVRKPKPTPLEEKKAEPQEPQQVPVAKPAVQDTLDTKAQEKAEKERIKAQEKAEKERIKAKEQERKDAEKAEKERIKAEEKAEKERIKAKEQERKDAEKVEKDRIKAKEQERKDAAKAKEDARKAKEKERKERAKAKEQERKQKEKEKKEKAKQKEKERKERAKQKEAERKQKEAERRAARKR